ncbi:hypothetical protein FRACYDRAFT_245663 [Fragilariopsis cylindrus CCMP1102]|uniref:Uncharacterized protein n=1 Tax=Fragilariopsis cylindrus CCMP1102 TaxID=635003 RepID=A0A1E7F0L6_9STRA|nr:hypothetical protein FRACYDRAFT_245663 [Fragilariopsis cylindrus CCMP1102]|eukprot:OEU11343.1 hypothetical protein FRACYDRAFT_245663 [Fragilariopsis cylindrus CCMP1102]
MNNPPITKTSLFYSSAFGRRNDRKNENSNNSTTITSTSILERLQVNGISVSPKGFHLLMEASGGGRDEQEQHRKELVEGSDDNDKDNNSNNNDDRNKLDTDEELQQTRDSGSTDNDCGGTTVSSACRRVVPLKMTTDPADTYQATSPESLTLCQLLSGVDMAGAILPPELLGKIVVYHIEEKYSNYDHEEDDHDEEEENEQQVLLEENYSSESSSSDFSSSSSSISYRDAYPWLQSRIRLPQQQQQQSSQGQQLPSQKEEGNDESNNQDALNDTTTYVDSSSRSSSSSSSNTAAATYWSRDELDRDFPQRLGLRSLQQQSTRVTDNIERGFEIHKLTGALQIAKRLGDEAAAVQIRAKLDDYDSMKDLPTTIVSRTHSSTCNNNEQDGEDNNEEKYNDGDGNDRLVDDFDKNILQ